MNYRIGQHLIAIEGKSVFVDNTLRTTFDNVINQSTVQECADGDCLVIFEKDGVYLISEDGGDIKSAMVNVPFLPNLETVDEFLVSKGLIAYELDCPNKLILFDLSSRSTVEVPLDRHQNIKRLILQNQTLMADIGPREKAGKNGAEPHVIELMSLYPPQPQPQYAGAF